MQNSSHPPGPKGHWLLGSLPDYKNDILNLFLNSANEHGEIVRFRLANRHAYLVSDPACIERVLRTRNRYYNKNTHGVRRLKVLLGDGLVTSWGNVWHRQRRISQQAFHKQKLFAMDVNFVAAAVKTEKSWTNQIESNAEVNITESMMRHTIHTASSTMFSTELANVAGAIIDSFVTLNEIANRRVPRIFNLPFWVPSRENRDYLKASNTLSTTVQTLINSRRQSGKESNDLLSLLMAAKDEETGEGFSDFELGNQLLTLLVGGFDTSANVLSFALYSLANNPDIQAKAKEEADRVLGDKLPTSENLHELDYINRVLAETMRLYPPVWLFGRNALEDDTLGNFGIPQGSLVMVPPFVAHRNPRYWPDPERFDPDRHLPERRKDAPKFSYYPFGGGPRQCIGMGYANTQMPLTIAHLIRLFKLSVPSDYTLKLRPAITLGTEEPIRLTIKAHPKNA